jgi:Tol biopolymer transport system component
VVYASAAPAGPALSPDGKHLAIFRFLDGNMDIWAYGTEQGTWDRVTYDTGDDINPLWSHDGATIIFGSRRAGRMDLFRKRVGGPPGSEELLLSTPDVKFPMDVSLDGAFLVYSIVAGRGNLDIWAIRLDRPQPPIAVVQTDYNDQLPQFSPNGKWLAYQSNRAGRDEIYLRPFPGPGSDVPVSPHGGTRPRWNRDGSELFYVEPAARLMAVGVRFGPDGASFQLDAPRELFAGPIRAQSDQRQQYVVAPDGKSFILASPVAQTTTSISVILNWELPGR